MRPGTFFVVSLLPPLGLMPAPGRAQPDSTAADSTAADSTAQASAASDSTAADSTAADSTAAESTATASAASANTAAAFGATARVKAPMAATQREDPTAAGTAIDTRDRRQALEDTAEALVEAPGLRALVSGGAGARSVVALRGAESAQTAYWLGDIPIDSVDQGAFDVSVLPLTVLQRIEVFRGGAPAWYSAGAIGGVIRFVPAIGGTGKSMPAIGGTGKSMPAVGGTGELAATLGVGSFGRSELRVTGSLEGNRGLRPKLFWHVRALRADNNYAYWDDGQTRFDPSDDRERRQQNGQIAQGDGLLHLSLNALDGQLTLLLSGHGRSEGIPGPLAAPTRRVRRKLVRGLAALSYHQEADDPDGERRYRVQLVASGSHQLNAFTDLFAELGTSRQVASEDRWQRASVRAAGSLRLLPFLEATAIASLAHDAYSPEERAAFSLPEDPSTRWSQVVTLESRLYGKLWGLRAELRPSARLAFAQTNLHLRNGLEAFDASRQDFAPTFRIAGALEPFSGLTLAASWSTGVRLPSISELFGDRVFQLPNPALEPERGTSADVGAVLQGRAGPLRGSIEARGFALFLSDLIRFERTAQYTVRPANLESGEVLGAELGLRGQVGRHVSLVSALTAMHSQGPLGQLLPLRPPLSLLVRPQVQASLGFIEAMSAFIELNHVSFVYLDRANLAHLPGRTFFAIGASMRFLGGGLRVDARLRNVFDARATDILSRPLPGREFRLALTGRVSFL